MECWKFFVTIAVVMGITTAMLELVFVVLEKIRIGNIKGSMMSTKRIARQMAAGVE